MYVPIVLQVVQWGALPSLDILVAEFDQWLEEERPKKPKRAFLKALHFTLRQIALNLLVVQRGPSDLRLWVPGGKDWYRQNKPVLGPLITQAAVRHVVTFLSQNSYATWRKGTPSSSKSFRSPNSVRPTRRLLTLLEADLMTSPYIVRPDELAAPIRLKSAKGSVDEPTYLPVPDNEETRRMSANMETINRTLSCHWADLDAGYGAEAEIVRHMTVHDGYDRHIDYGRRTLYRVFNNGSLEEGGRLYGGWWQDIPSRYRPFITIDGEETVEVDYRAMHPTMLYAEIGLAKPEDPYDIGLGKRKVVKRTVNALISAGGTSIGRVEGFSEADVGMSWVDFLSKVKCHFSAFRPYFGKGYGLKLQRSDSDIAEAVLLHFAGKGVPVLPVHDSFIVQKRCKRELIEVMKHEFEASIGVSPSVRVTSLTSDERKERDARNAVLSRSPNDPVKLASLKRVRKVALGSSSLGTNSNGRASI